MSQPVHEHEAQAAPRDGAASGYCAADYQGEVPRWCQGCGNNAILTALRKLCVHEQLPPERTVFVSGIGCASRLPHYMSTYGFHGVHGRALPIAEGIKVRRPDLHVFVNTGDGDCCSIGAGHWLHALRYNMDMTVLLHDNRVYGLTKKQASPTSPLGLVTQTTPHGARLPPINPLSVTLATANVSFVAQAVDWLPGPLFEMIRLAFHHRGLSFVSILQRCPHYLADHFDQDARHPDHLLLLTHRDGVASNASLERKFPHRLEHDPSDLRRARELAVHEGKVVLGVLYRNEAVPRYEDVQAVSRPPSTAEKMAAIEREFDRFAVYPAASGPR